MDLVNEVIERLLVTMDQIDKSLDSLGGIFLTDCIVVISALPMTSRRKKSRTFLNLFYGLDQIVYESLHVTQGISDVGCSVHLGQWSIEYGDYILQQICGKTLQVNVNKRSVQAIDATHLKN